MLSTEMFDYDEYTRYLNNLNCMYRRIDRLAEVTSTIRDYGRGHRGHSLSVYVAGIGQTLAENEQRVIRELSEDCSTRNPGAWIVMDLTLDQIYRSNVLPRDWIASILPHILKSNEYVDDQFLYWQIDTCDTTCNDCGSNSQEISISNRHIALLDQLLALYEQGSIVGRSDSFNAAWELEMDENGIYHPTWWNMPLTRGDVTLYLTEASEQSSYQEEATSFYLRLERESEVNEQ